MFPAESLGTDYLVTVPASPSDPNTPATGQMVRIVGNFDDTKLTFDPPQSFATAIKQYRTDYLFLAPADYDLNFINITRPRNAGITVDGVALPESQFTPVGSSGMGVWRHLLSASGHHTLKAQEPVGIQVYGYGSFTSYQYPGEPTLPPSLRLPQSSDLP